MIQSMPEAKARQVLLQDAARRDLPTARRIALLDILWNERFLTRAQLVMRVDLKVGSHCFGKTAWEDNFYRDMRVVKQAFAASGLKLGFSRRKTQSGYYLVDQGVLSKEMAQVIHAGLAEVDLRQIEIYQQLSPADRFRQGRVISDTSRQVVAYRIRAENPGISADEANRLALQRAYRR